METVGPKQAKIFEDWASPDQIAAIKAKLKDDVWIPRFGGSLESYGRAWYLDIESGLLPLYHYEAEKTNRALVKLPHLLMLMMGALTKIERISDVHEARPRKHAVNFGIVRVPGWANCMNDRPMRSTKNPFTDKGGVPHNDLEGVAAHPDELWNFKDSRAYSAILCLETPAQGGGLRVWPKRCRADSYPPDSTKGSMEFDYKPGSLMVFDSWCYHQILPSTYTADHPQRMIAGIHFLWRPDGMGGGHWECWF